MSRAAWLAILTGAAVLGACSAPVPTVRETSRPSVIAGTAEPSPTAVFQSVSNATPQPTATVAFDDTDPDDTAADINPMTGLRVSDPNLLDVPALLVSISHFPATGRPQAGLSFAPFVYEFSITKGESRFLAAFYGQFPVAETAVKGDCTVRTEVFRQTRVILGNLVWLDSNANGLQDIGEPGIPGICVILHDERGGILQATTTDSNGFYGFNVDAGRSYSLEFLKPSYLDFTARDMAGENADSDVDPASGGTAVFALEQSGLDWDAGIVLNGGKTPEATDGAAMPKAEVGPIRSGRLLYRYLAESYTNSCLIYAFASPEVLQKLPHCAFVSHEETNGGEMISIERLRAVATDNMRHTASRAFDYSSNVYSELPPPGGIPASQLNVFFGNINQSGWIYDPLYQAYLRYVDNADVNARGVLHPDFDRLTGRQLHFENVVVVMADTDVVTTSNLDIHLEAGNTGPAKLFRDGQLYSIVWSTRGGTYEHQTGLRKPIRFLNVDGSPAALKPGHTWVIIVTPFSPFEPQSNGSYLIKYAPPAGEAQ